MTLAAIALALTRLKKRAKALRLPPPWSAQKTPTGRTLWLNRDGIAARMGDALVREERKHLRQLGELWPLALP